MRNVAIALVAVVVLGVSVVLGFASASPARATYGYGLYINPGAYRNAMTCGWHGECGDTPTAGNALDWGNLGNDGVYWRSWATADSGSGTIGYAYPQNSSSPACYITGANVYSLAWVWRGTVAYTHSSVSSTSGIYINGSWTGAFTASGPIATTVSSEKSADCPWSSAHLHQYSTSSGWYANTAVYPGYVNAGTGYDLNSFGNWQNRTSWSE